MTPSELIKDITNLLRLLSKTDIALYISPVIQKNITGGMVRITWGGPGNNIGDMFRGEFATIDEYCNWLHCQAFSALLFDGSILQFSYDFDEESLRRHRLAYYPCPYDVDLEWLKSDPVLDVVELYRNQDESHVRLRSPLRFDFDMDNAAEEHPAAHLTVNCSHCRWAVMAPLSPGHFVRFVFRHFYPEFWRANRFIREWPQNSTARTITREEQAMLHVHCL